MSRGLTILGLALIGGWAPALGLGSTAGAEPARPLRVWVVGDRGFHDYTRLTPGWVAGLTNNLGAVVTVATNRQELTNATFAAAADVVVYDLCFDEADASVLAAMRRRIEGGQGAVLLHCAVHAFGRFDHTPEECCGPLPDMDAQWPRFSVRRVEAAAAPLSQDWPTEWTTPGGEPERRTSPPSGAQRLLVAGPGGQTPARVAAWTEKPGRGRIFALSLGHTAATMAEPHYQRLLAKGVRWAAGREETPPAGP